MAIKSQEVRRNHTTCLLHPNEVIRFFCNTCSQGICTECIINHSGHIFVKQEESIQFLREKAHEIQTSIYQEIETIKSKKSEAEHVFNIMLITSKDNQAKITSSFGELSEELTKRRQLMVDTFLAQVQKENEKLTESTQSLYSLMMRIEEQLNKVTGMLAEVENKSDQDLVGSNYASEILAIKSDIASINVA